MYSSSFCELNMKDKLTISGECLLVFELQFFSYYSSKLHPNILQGTEDDED